MTETARTRLIDDTNKMKATPRRAGGAIALSECNSLFCLFVGTSELEAHSEKGKTFDI